MNMTVFASPHSPNASRYTAVNLMRRMDVVF